MAPREERPRQDRPRDDRPRDQRPRGEERRDDGQRPELRTRPRTDKPVAPAPAPVPVTEVRPEPVGDAAREELLLLAAPRVTTAKPQAEKKEKPRTAKEALQLRARQQGQAKGAPSSRRDRRERRGEGGDAMATSSRVDDAPASSSDSPSGPPSSKPASRPASSKKGRRAPAPPEPQLDAVPPLPKPGLWSRIKGFFGG